MANPFDQFKTRDEEEKAKASAAAASAPAVDPAAANPFDAPGAEPQRKGPLPPEEAEPLLYDYLDNPANSLDLGDMNAWFLEHAGRTLPKSKGLIQALTEAQLARQQGRKGNYPPIADSGGMSEAVDKFGTMYRGLTQPGAFYFGDEAQSGLAALYDMFGGKSFGDAYNDRLQQAQLVDKLDYEINPELRNASEIAGLVPAAFAPIGAAKSLNLGRQVLTGAGYGAAMGAASGAGSSKPGERLEGATEGGLVGLATGVAAPIVARGVTAAAAPLIERGKQALNLSINQGETAARAFARRLGLSPQQIDDLETRAAEQAQLVGDDAVSAFDVLPEHGRNVVGEAGSRNSTREQFQDFANARTEALPERVQAQAGRIGPRGARDANPPRSTPTQQQEGLEAYRDEDMNRVLASIRGEPLPITPEITQILATREGQRAIRDAIASETDFAARANLEKLSEAARMMNGIDPRLPPAAREQIAAQIMQGVKFDINASDKIANALQRRARSGRGDERTLLEFGRTVRDSARGNQRYNDQLRRSAAQDESVAASQLGGTFLTENADEFAQGVTPLSTDATSRMPKQNRREPEGVLDVSDSDRFKSQHYTDEENNAFLRKTEDDHRNGTTLSDSEIERYLERGGNDADIVHLADQRNIDVDFFQNWGPTLEPGQGSFAPPRTSGSRFNEYELAYTLPDGRTITGSIMWMPGSDNAGVVLHDIGNWADLNNRYGRNIMQDIAISVGRKFPEIRQVHGERVTGASVGAASANPGRWSGGVTQTVRTDESLPAPSDLDLARSGAQYAVREQAGKGPTEAATVARKLSTEASEGTPPLSQQQKTIALVGPEKAKEVSAAMDAEIKRVERAQQQASRSGPGKATTGNAVATSVVNALYNPHSPISWTRETLRFLRNIGISDKSAQWITTNATNPAKRQEVIDLLRKAGVDSLKAEAYVALLRNMATRGATGKEP